MSDNSVFKLIADQGQKVMIQKQMIMQDLIGSKEFSSHESSKMIEVEPEKKLKVSDVGYRYATVKGKENRSKSSDAVQKIKKPNE